MGYELESALNPVDRVDALATRSLHARWDAANRRLAAALHHYRALRGQLQPGDPGWLAAKLRIAESRQRCRELADALADGEAVEAG